MAAELTNKETFLDQKLVEIQFREDTGNLESLVRKSVEEALKKIKIEEVAAKVVAGSGDIGWTKLLLMLHFQNLTLYHT